MRNYHKLHVPFIKLNAIMYFKNFDLGCLPNNTKVCTNSRISRNIKFLVGQHYELDFFNDEIIKFYFTIFAILFLI